MTPSDEISNYLDQVGSLLYTVPRQPVQDIVDAILTACQFGRTVYIIGAGTSSTTASHFAFDLQRSTIEEQTRRVKAIALTDNLALFSTLMQDGGLDRILKDQLQTFLNRGDVLIALSVGDSWRSLVGPLRYACAQGAVTVVMTGPEGDHLMPLIDHCLVVPGERKGQVDSLHMALCHVLVDAVRTNLAQTKAASSTSTKDREMQEEASG